MFALHFLSHLIFTHFLFPSISSLLSLYFSFTYLLFLYLTRWEFKVSTKHFSSGKGGDLVMVETSFGYGFRIPPWFWVPLYTRVISIGMLFLLRFIFDFVMTLFSSHFFVLFLSSWFHSRLLSNQWVSAHPQPAKFEIPPNRRCERTMSIIAAWCFSPDKTTPSAWNLPKPCAGQHYVVNTMWFWRKKIKLIIQNYTANNRVTRISFFLPLWS